MFCGKEFDSQVIEQKFWSHDCYIRNRFWRVEDKAEIEKLLLARNKVPMVPKWINDSKRGEKVIKRGKRGKTPNQVLYNKSKG